MISSVSFVAVLTFTAISAKPALLGDSKASPGKFPYYAIVRGGGLLCGGSIISSHLVLTAAHCVYKKKADTYSITVGTNRLHSGGRVYKATRIIWSDKYNSTTLHNDVGFVQVKGRIHFNEIVRPIKLATAPPEVGEIVTMMGFGMIDVTKKVFPEMLNIKHLTVFSLENCKSAYETGVVNQGNICTWEPRSIGICGGDSGGPLVNFNGQQVGIASFGPEDCKFSAPDAFSSVIYYRAFIKRVLRKYH